MWLLIVVLLALLAVGIFIQRVWAGVVDLEKEAREQAAATALSPSSTSLRSRASIPLTTQWEKVMDLTPLPSSRFRVKGTGFVVQYDERASLGGTTYCLVREPKNDHDANAIAVYSEGRKVGYVSAVKAASRAAELDRLGADAYLVRGAGATDHSIKLWLDLPSLAALRRHAG